MKELDIKRFPASCLRIKARAVKNITQIERDELAAMVETMYLNKGVGLAAVQVGIDKQMAVIDVGNGVIKLINPQIIKRSGRESQEEGCLSVPGCTVKIRRAKNITLRYLDEKSETRQIACADLFSRAVQHEIDHLRGVLIIDYLNPLKRLFVKRS